MMVSRWFSLLLFFLLSLEIRWTQGCLEHERYALLQLKSFFNIPYDLQDWVEGDYNSNCCEWELVECNNTTGRVITLDLGYSRNGDLGEWYLNASLFSPLQELQKLVLWGNQIAGCIENQGFDKLSTLSNLKTLELSENNFNNSILSSIRRLSSLKSLDLSDNKLKGIVDLQELDSHINLQSLFLYGNEIDGIVFPKGLCELVHLQELYLSNNDLRGALPSCFANLTSLQVLDISFNHFRIPISLEPFFNHSKLKTFICKNNDLYDEPELQSSAPKFQLNYIKLSGCKGSCTFPKFLYHQYDLRVVVQSHNNFTAEFPDWLLENNTRLVNLALANNSLTGPFHLPIHPHVILMTLDISMNMFNGHIPAEVGAYFPGLTILNISRNAFEAYIPSSVGDMNLLRSLDLSYNRLSGGIPEHLAENCIKLILLVLSNNSLQGQIFSKNFNLRNLQSLQLDGNDFFGKIPDSLSNSSSLMGLYLSDNRLSGEIPSWLGNMSSLREIIISNNQLEGPIPPDFCQLKYLEVLNLAGNSISNIPSCFRPLSLKQVHLSRNMLHGELQDSFCNCSSLITLDLAYNRITGSIPNWIGRLSNLTYLILNNNKLQGRVPIPLCQLDQLRLIDFSQNNHSGHIPPCLMSALHDRDYIRSGPSYYESNVNTTVDPLMGKEEAIEFRTKTISYFYHGKILANMSGIDLSCNKLTDEIPFQIGNLTVIRALNLSHNNLTGAIPPTFSNLKQIESLDLSYNNLNGEIPRQLAELYTLEVFTVAYNNLSGKTLGLVAQFITFNESSYEGNPLLCGLPLPKSCDSIESPRMLQPTSTEIKEENDFMDMDIFYISFIVSYTIMLLGIIVVLFINPYWRQTWFYFVETLMTFFYHFIVDHLSKRLCG